MTAIYESCLDRTVAMIQGLALAGIASGSIVKRKVPWTRNLTLPTIVVSPDRDTVKPATNESDDVEYGVVVAFVRASNQEMTSGIGTTLQWREDVRKLFSAKAIVATLGIASVYNVRVEPAVVQSEPAFLNQHDVGALRLIFVSRERRT
jgi:hypothetical protein